MLLALPLLGLAAGALTTLAGQGGGLILLLVCSALMGPHAALAVTTPALLLGNLHRTLLLRRHLDRPIAARMVPTALAGALLGGLLAGLTPGWVLRVLLVGLTLAALAKALRLVHFAVPRWALGPAGVGLGVLTGTAGGAGVLVVPILLSVGLTGPALVATVSATAVAMHVGRVVGYAALGLFSRDLVLPVVLVAAAIFAGNALGARAKLALSRTARAALWPSWEGILEYGALIVSVVLSVAGLG